MQGSFSDSDSDQVNAVSHNGVVCFGIIDFPSAKSGHNIANIS